ncbi:MAG: type II toxin-antitoxin system VapC family toxin [Candidatus Thiosymbion ectosymbiont of Robbea hypermnestra]|nr:type II toxin-antitoxin system VapC family toxin [Candidatus Thiosymbion ectosymbiont of Robbea hypermnestra]
MNFTVYLETSIIGYLASFPSRDLITAANQQLTHDWWDNKRKQYDLYVSETVIAECSAGDPQAAQERMDMIGDIPILNVTEDAENLADELVKQIPLPENAEVDALHIAIATVNGVNYLLTWNCAHIANAALQPRIETICRSTGFEPPAICTPQQLMED